jgi:hypothetical protein
MSKAKGKGQKAKVKSNLEARILAPKHLRLGIAEFTKSKTDVRTRDFLLLPFAFCALPFDFQLLNFES